MNRLVIPYDVYYSLSFIWGRHMRRESHKKYGVINIGFSDPWNTSDMFLEFDTEENMNLFKMKYLT